MALEDGMNVAEEIGRGEGKRGGGRRRRRRDIGVSAGDRTDGDA